MLASVELVFICDETWTRRDFLLCRFFACAQTWMQVPRAQLPIELFTGSCDPANNGAGDQTQVLCKNGPHSYLLSCLSISHIWLFSMVSGDPNSGPPACVPSSLSYLPGPLKHVILYANRENYQG